MKKKTILLGSTLLLSGIVLTQPIITIQNKVIKADVEPIIDDQIPENLQGYIKSNNLALTLDALKQNLPNASEELRTKLSKCKNLHNLIDAILEHIDQKVITLKT